MTDLQHRLQHLDLELPECPQPVAAYVPAMRHGSQVFVSGQLPFHQGVLLSTGGVPVNTSIAQAQACARQCLLNGISAALQVLEPGESLGRLIQLNGFVQSAPGFTQHPAVINGASELALDIWGDLGKHSRTAVGVSSLPLDAPVEIALIFGIKSH